MTIINRLTDNIKNNSAMNIGVAAVLLRGSRQIGRICGNYERNYCHGQVCPSIHAEVNAITSYFGKHISYSPKHGWQQCCLKEGKESDGNEEVKYYGDKVRRRW